MKIYSKFQDYYDCALGSFLESDVIVSRNTSHETLRTKDIPSLGDFDARWTVKEQVSSNHARYSHKTIGMIGFCGKWFYFIYENDKCRYATLEDIRLNNEQCHWYKAQQENYKDPDNIEWWNKTIFEKYGPVIYIPEYNPFRSWTPHWEENRKQEIVIWPNLKALDFQSVKDPYTALWEIEHWFDTHARPDEAIVPVGDDITRLQAYGFDKKTSFRKAKEK